jgi:hypothetical protein
MSTSTTTRARGFAWGLGLCLVMGVGLGACFNPPSDASATGPDLGCELGTFGCPCTGAGACGTGLQCQADVCVDETDPTGTSSATGIATTTPDETSADGSGNSTGPGDTTLALDGTSSGDGTTGDATTSDGTTGDPSTSGGSSSTGVPPEPAMETVNFPTAADPRTITAGTLPWNVGDFFEGMRNTTVPSVSQLDVHVVIVSNGLTACGFQEAEVSLNGIALGTFVVAQGTAVIDQSFGVPGVVGPNYTIRYETVATVEGGCGAAGYDENTSTVTLWE